MIAAMPKREGWTGWDTYAPFYDWENARTLGRRDVPFWRSVALRNRGPVLELGCGTGRISLPLARAGVSVVGIDRSAPMLERAAKRLTAMRKRAGGRGKKRLHLVRGDIRYLPFERARFKTVLAPYGVLQSLVRDKDLNATLASVADVLAPGGLFGVDLVPDVPNWREYANRIQLKGQGRGRRTPDPRRVGPAGSQEAPHDLRADLHRAPGHQGDGAHVRPDVPHAADPDLHETPRTAGFAIEAVLGDYRGGPWDERADVWIMLARRL